jgi:CNT family concentrative nucleoside transporter
VPAALTIARLMVPETDDLTAGNLAPPQQANSSMDALTRGTSDGLRLLVNIVAMLIVLVAVISLINQILESLPAFGGEPLSLQRLVGILFAPLSWLIGIPWSEAGTAGALLGTKTVLNEFIAYLDMAALPAAELSERSKLILTYALCGFANPGSLGIMIGGMGSMAPERRGEIVALGPKAIIAGTLATCMTGAMAALFY